MAGKKPIPAHDVEMGGGSGGGVRGSTIRPAPKGGGRAKKTYTKGKSPGYTPRRQQPNERVGLSTPKTRALARSRARVDAKSEAHAKRVQDLEASGKSSKRAYRDMKSSAKDSRTLSDKLAKAKKGKSFKVKTKAAADAKAKKVLREMAAKKGGAPKPNRSKVAASNKVLKKDPWFEEQRSHSPKTVKLRGAKVSTTPGKAGVIKPKKSPARGQAGDKNKRPKRHFPPREMGEMEEPNDFKNWKEWQKWEAKQWKAETQKWKAQDKK
tara:strand:+ start:4686 stop:5486 length:801 start_codon:yes stop_codon:yes gene_type:complete